VERGLPTFRILAESIRVHRSMEAKRLGTSLSTSLTIRLTVYCTVLYGGLTISGDQRSHSQGQSQVPSTLTVPLPYRLLIKTKRQVASVFYSDINACQACGFSPLLRPYRRALSSWFLQLRLRPLPLFLLSSVVQLLCWTHENIESPVL
jgi:hypothetical protein